MVGRMKRAFVLQVCSYIPRYDRLRIQGPRKHCKSSTDASILLFSSLSATYFFCFTQVDDTPPSVSRSGKLIELLPSGPISLIGNNAPSLAALMHRGARFKKITTIRAKTSSSVAAAALAQAFKVESLFFFNLYRFYPILTQFFQDTSAAMGTSSVTFIVSTKIPSTLCYVFTYETFIIVSANWQIDEDQKYQDSCRCPPV